MTTVPATGVLRTLLSLAWPIVVSRSTQVVIGLCDALMVASLGETALAATTTGAMNVFTALVLPMGICFIVASFVSQLIGKGDRVGARRYGFYGLVIALVTELLCLLAIPFVPTLLGWFEYDPALTAAMSLYMVTRLVSGGAVVGVEALGNYYGGLGDTVTPMRVNVLIMILNVALNGVLIFGYFGAPALGVEGAALASVIATTIGFVVLVVAFVREGRALGSVVAPLKFAEFVRLLKFGLPAGFNWFFEFLSFSFFVNVVVAGLGTIALAAMMTVLQINSVAFMPAFGVASAGAILVGHRIGGARIDEVPRMVRVTLMVAASWQAAAGVLYLFAPELVFRPFATGASAEFLEIGVSMLMISAAWQIFDATTNTYAEALRAAGDTAYTLWARMAVGYLFFVPGSYLSVHYFDGGYIVATMWLVAYLGVLSLVLYFRFRSGVWQKIALIDT